MVHDLRLATDLLLAQPQVDPERVLCIGHSLGGKN
jgi:dienelactone hydrolase